MKTNSRKSAPIILSLLVVVILSACGGKTGEGDGTNGNGTGGNGAANGSGLSFEKNGLKVYSMDDSPAYADAELTLIQPPQGADLPEGKNTFEFDVKNFELGIQTPGGDTRGLANSKDGQHIHFILDNEPYHAHYGKKFEHDLKTGVHVLLTFLSRSYHESVKNPKAFQVRHFIVGNPGLFSETDLTKPHLFYSRPKDKYYGADTKKVLLDFYLINCTLAADGFKVKATINGTEFMLPKWTAYIVEGLPMGESIIQLELQDATGKVVESPFNPCKGKIMLAEQKPA